MDDGPIPSLQTCFSLQIVAGEPVAVGALATGGARRHIPVVGGRLEGAGLVADVLPGHGGETWLTRIGGVGVVEVSYILQTAGGDVMRLIGKGYATAGPHYCGTRVAFQFEAEESGNLAWLSTRVFVGQRAAAADRFDIAMVL